MVRRIALVFAALVLCACKSSGAANSGIESTQAPDSFLITLPKPDTLIIIGVSGRQSKRETEIETALEDAARKASMYNGVRVSFKTEHNTGPGFFDYYTGSEINLEYDRELEKYKEKLIFSGNTDIMALDRGIIIRFSFTASFPENVSYSFARNPDGRPGWITNPPGRINSLIAGVGYSGRLSRFGDAFEKSCNAAAADIVSRLSTVVEAKETSAEYQNTSSIHQYSEGYLESFIVLDIWIDPVTQAVWTLAVAGNKVEI
jgi:hypothetical protein